MKTFFFLLSSTLILKNLKAQTNPNIVNEIGYVVFADGDTVRGKVSIDFVESEEPGNKNIRSMDVGRVVNIEPFATNAKSRKNQKVLCFFVRNTRYESIAIKDESALGFISKMATVNAANIHFYKSYYQAGIFSVFQDPINEIFFAIKKDGEEKAIKFFDIIKKKKAAKSFIESCEALKNLPKKELNNFKDVKLFVDFLNTNCK